MTISHTTERRVEKILLLPCILIEVMMLERLAQVLSIYRNKQLLILLESPIISIAEPSVYINVQF